jgi:NAD(P)-dependent dehydrogenase (short-subunit alcohol dehydrogenase family)
LHRSGRIVQHQPEPFYSRYIAKVPLGRMAVPDNLKGVTVFLASSASGYITGAVISVDGGLTVQ